MIRMNSPEAARMPVLTAAPFPMLYGWLITWAPADRARAAVPSDDPSSTTMISRHAPVDRNAATTESIELDSLYAGMSTLVAETSAMENKGSDVHNREGHVANPKSYHSH